MRQTWIDFVMRMQRMIERRTPDSATVTMVVTNNGPSFTIEMVSHQLEPKHLPALIIYLSESMSQKVPNADSIKELQSHVKRLLGSGDVADASKGLN